MHIPTMRRVHWILLFTLIISACGFQLRGTTELSFKSLNLQGRTLSISRDLKQSFKTNGIQLVEQQESAEVLMELLGESNEKRILSLSGGGLVREFVLNYKVNFRMREQSSPIWGQVQTVEVRRDFSYDDTVLLGKAEEEARLNADMRKDAVREVLRRLSAVKPSTKTQN
jgi:LPS-assembly lipoprotein